MYLKQCQKILIKKKLQGVQGCVVVSRYPGSFYFVVLYPQRMATNWWTESGSSSICASTFQALGKREGQRRVCFCFKEISRVSPTIGH